MVKCLVWDLDNTLWQGTLLEDGEVRLAEEIRQVVKELDARGILQAVASRNDHEPTWARLTELGIAEYFVLAEIGWGPKSGSVAAIAQRLNFAPKTIAFIDDQPAERAEVQYHLPEVRCYPASQALELTSLPEFTPTTRTIDSGKRRAMYQANFRRDAERSQYTGPDEDFLRSLQLELTIVRATEAELSRVEELTLRTSQMNATGVHYSDSVLRDLVADPAHEVLVATLTDRFGTHGAIGVLLVEYHAAVWHLKLLATSCRVVSFGVGTAILNWLCAQAFQAGVHLAADFRRTDRNRMMEIAYRFAGFEDSSCPCLDSVAASPDVQRLHLAGEHRDPPNTMRLSTPTLTR
ncbi:HAD-IIIC family phosphatase [Actinocrispum sp. NPDC049592]|uniref:HAD-IIIC family phosphatase n=1 Tax=Actinocrispum sp. NPDC049592 TaxID=3154835 RepID=UPI003423C5FF